MKRLGVLLAAVLCLIMFVGCSVDFPDSESLGGTVKITGTPQVGRTLEADVSGLGGSGTMEIQWVRNKTVVVSINSGTYTPQVLDTGSTITVIVTRSGNSGSVTSNPTEKITLPNLTGMVSITGIAQVGQTLTANTSSLVRLATGTISYQWKSGATNVGTNNSTYIVQDSDVDKIITVTVTNTHNLGSITSNPTDKVIFPTITGTVSITGTVRVGQTLTANTASVGGSGTLSYQWKRGTTEIGDNSETYTVLPADVGETITVTVTRNDRSGNVTSNPTVTVPLGDVSVVGTPAVGEFLFANTSNLGGSGDIQYQWKRGNTNVGTNSSTYEVQTADVGANITVVVTRNEGSVTSSPVRIE